MQITICGAGTGDVSLDELGVCRSDELSSDWFTTETDTWEKIIRKSSTMSLIIFF